MYFVVSEKQDIIIGRKSPFYLFEYRLKPSQRKLSSDPGYEIWYQKTGLPGLYPAVKTTSWFYILSFESVPACKRGTDADAQTYCM